MTEKQARFVDEYLVDCNITQAAIRAGYSEKTAYSIGSENLRKPEIQEAIKARLAELQSKKVATVQEIMEYLTSVMRREQTETVVVTLTDELSEYVPDANGTMRQRKMRHDTAEKIEIPSRLSDANRAAEMLGKRYGIFTDNVNIGAQTPTIIDDIPDGEVEPDDE